jgi:hypothetical protein
VVATTDTLTLALSQREREQEKMITRAVRYGLPLPHEGMRERAPFLLPFPLKKSRLESFPYYSLSLWERAGVRALRIRFLPATIP